MKWLFYIVIYCCWAVADAQSGDTFIQTWMDKAYALEQTNPDSALLLYKWIQQHTSRTDDDLNHAKSLHYQGIVFSDQVQYDSSVYYYEAAKSVYERIAYPKGVAAIYTNLANIEQFRSNYKKAINYYQLAIPLFEQIEDLTNVSRTENNLSNVFHELNMQPEAVEHAQTALELAKQLDNTFLMTDALHNLGSYVLAQGDTLLAIEYSSRSMELARENNDLYNLINNYERRANLYFDRDPMQALQYALEAKTIAEQINLPRRLYNTYASVGLAYNYVGQYDSAVYYLQQAIAQSYLLDLPYDRLRYLNFLQRTYQDKSNTDEAFRVSVQYNELQDSIYDIELSRAIAEIETQYEVERTHQQLQNQTAISERERQNRIAWTIATALLGLTLIASSLWYRQRAQRDQLARQLQQTRIQRLEQEQKVLTLHAMISGQEEERKRIAKDLHDSVGSLLSTVKLSFKSIQKQIDLLETVNVYERVNQLLNNASEEVRRISHDMMPDVLKISLSEGIRELAQQLEESSSLRIQLEEIGQPKPLEGQQKIMLYRVVQELTQNVLKHAAAQHLLLQLIWQPDQLQLIVEDDGTGFDVTDVENGLGLRSVRSRVDFLGGELHIDSEVAEGTSVHIRLAL